MRALLIIPAYNEEKSIRKTLEDLLNVQLPMDVLVVVDGARDKTFAIARDFPIYVISHPYNMGYGAALQSGYKFAVKNGYTHVLQYDADGQHCPDDLKKLWQYFSESNADVVLGSRFLGETTYYPGVGKYLAIMLFRFTIRLFTGVKITDPTSGLRGLSLKVFQYFSVIDRFPSDYPDADIVLQILLKGGKVKEMPVGSREREEGKSMHSGMKPVGYMLKVGLSIFVVLMSHIVYGREKPFHE